MIINFFKTTLLLLIFPLFLINGQDNNTYKNKTWGFKIEYPEDWEQYSKTLDSGFVFMAGKDIDAKRKVAVSVIVASSASLEGKNLDDYSEDELKDLTKDSRKGLDNFSISKKKIDNTPAVYMSGIVKNKVTGENMSAVYYFIIKNNMLYILMGAFEVNDPDFNDKYFINIFEKQFKFY